MIEAPVSSAISCKPAQRLLHRRERGARIPHRLPDGLVISVGCTLEPIARRSPHGEHGS
jgi:hypothetical protein